MYNQSLVVFILLSIWDLKTILNITVFITWNYGIYIQKLCSYDRRYSDNQEYNIVIAITVIINIVVIIILFL